MLTKLSIVAGSDPGYNFVMQITNVRMTDKVKSFILTHRSDELTYAAFHSNGQEYYGLSESERDELISWIWSTMQNDEIYRGVK